MPARQLSEEDEQEAAALDYERLVTSSGSSADDDPTPRARIKELSARFHLLCEEAPPCESYIRELKRYTKGIELDVDPSSVPTARLNEKIQKIQGYRNRATIIESDAIANLLLWKNLWTDIKTEEEKCLGALLSRPEVKAERNQTLRDAKARSLLPSGIENLKRLIERGFTIATIFDRQIHGFKENFAAAYESVSRQESVLQTQAEMGEISRSTSRFHREELHDDEDDDDEDDSDTNKE